VIRLLKNAALPIARVCLPASRYALDSSIVVRY
jgi:hypothetical protein